MDGLFISIVIGVVAGFAIFLAAWFISRRLGDKKLQNAAQEAGF